MARHTFPQIIMLGLLALGIGLASAQTLTITPKRVGPVSQYGQLQAVVSVCTRVLFLDRGEIVEDIAVDELASARSDCARELLGAVMPFQSEAGGAFGNDSKEKDE